MGLFLFVIAWAGVYLGLNELAARQRDRTAQRQWITHVLTKYGRGESWGE